MSKNNERFCVCISRAGEPGTRAALLNEARWPRNAEITITFLEGSDTLRQRVRNVADTWTGPGMANLTFKWVDDTAAAIRIAFRPGRGSWSYLGTVARSIPSPEPTMNYGWLTDNSSDDELKRVVLHEFGHALGLVHEHQNPEGGITWDEAAVINDLKGPPNNWDEPTIRRNVLDKYSSEDITATDFDRDSIMLYPIPAAWTNGSFSSDLNSDLSDKDKQLIRLAYN